MIIPPCPRTRVSGNSVRWVVAGFIVPDNRHSDPGFGYIVLPMAIFGFGRSFYGDP